MSLLPTLATATTLNSAPRADLRLTSRLSIVALAVVGSLSLAGCQKPAETSSETTASDTTLKAQRRLMAILLKSVFCTLYQGRWPSLRPR